MIKKKENSGLHFIQLEAYSQPKIVESKRDNWVEFGEDNNFFQFLIDRYNGSTTNNAVINNIVKLIYGRGLDATDSSKKPNEYAQAIMLFRKDVLKKGIADLKLLGQYAYQLIYNKQKTEIVRVEHIPVQLLRAEKCNIKGEIEAYYYCDNWEDTKKFVPKRIPAFGFGDKTLEILYVGNYTVGQKYYSNVDYVGCIPYAKLEEEIADYLINDVQNGFSPTSIVNFNNGIPDEEKRELISRQVTKTLTGSKGKKVVVSFNNDETKKTTIDSVPLNEAPKHYEYLSEESKSKILLGHGVVSGLQFGIPSASGFSSNADELKNAITLFDNMVIRYFQDTFLDGLDKILAYNKISLNLYFKTLQPLEFIDLNPNLNKEQLEEKTGVALSSHIDELNVEEFGEDIDLNEWELVDSRMVDLDTEEQLDAELEALNNPKKSLMSKIYEFVSTGVARPNIGSDQDGKLFQSRYRYKGEITEKSRLFCKKMIAANKLYRKEDIMRMSEKPVNEGFGPRGADTYDIFLYKGGGACHHYWMRETYKRFIDPRRKGAKEVTPAEARKQGEILATPFNKSDGKNYKKDSQLVYTKPINMPNKGFLPK
jgi:hypothetical protein